MLYKIDIDVIKERGTNARSLDGCIVRFLLFDIYSAAFKFEFDDSLFDVGLIYRTLR